MEKWKSTICRILCLAVLLASLLPALHSLSHKISVIAQNDTQMHYDNLDTGTHCDLCSFHLSTADFPEVHAFTTYNDFKEEVYTCSFEDQSNPYPFRLFQLRAPPALIG